MEVQENDVISYISFVLNRYNKERKLLDNLGCEELLKSLIIYNQLEDYIKDVKYVDPKDYRVNMSYSYFDKTINITNNFLNGIQRSSIRLLQMFKIHDEVISTNLDIVHALIHEVMHAKQYKLVDNSDDVFIKTILMKSLTAASFKETDNKEAALKYANASMNTDLYKLLPSELNAEINALKQTITIIEHLNINEKYKYLNMYDLNIKLIQSASYEKKFLFIKSPFDKFIKMRKKYLKEPINYSKSDISKYDLDTRLSYGLPISMWEFNQLNNDINDIVKVYINNL